jgi:hypothetical protein
MRVALDDICVGQTILVPTDDRPSTVETVTVSEISRHEYSFSSPFLDKESLDSLTNGSVQGWYEIIDTDGNHWQFNLDDIVEVAQ